MNEQEIKYQKAKERVEAIKGFYIHLTVYVVVNLILFSINMIVSPDSLWFIWPLMGWGIGFGISCAFRIRLRSQAQCRLGGEKDQRDYGKRIVRAAIDFGDR